MDTYTIRLKRRWLWDKKLKNVKGNYFPDDMNPAVNYITVKVKEKDVIQPIRNAPVKYMCVVFKNERILTINLDKYMGYETSEELFLIKARQVKEESQGKVDLVG
ncbi:hypothetical protein KJ966_24530 [bacterium]|nr:hypothetical protein [bacterium]